MQIRFFALNDDCGLDLVGDIEAAGRFPEVRFEVERHFENFVATIEVRQVLVYCTRLAEDLPGRIVAIEEVYLAHMRGKVKPEQQSRTLTWLIEDACPKVNLNSE